MTDDDKDLEPKSLFQLVPRRNMVLAAILLGLLVVIVVLRGQSGSLVKTFGDFMGPSRPAPGGTR